MAGLLLESEAKTSALHCIPAANPKPNESGHLADPVVAPAATPGPEPSRRVFQGPMHPLGGGVRPRSRRKLRRVLLLDPAPLLRDRHAPVVQLEAARLAEVLLSGGVDEVATHLLAALQAEDGAWHGLHPRSRDRRAAALAPAGLVGLRHGHLRMQKR